MVEYNLSITITAEQQAALEWLLRTLNAEHEANLRKPWPDVPTMLVALVTILIGEQYGDQYQAARQRCVGDALCTATPDQWAKVADILGMKLP